MANADTPKGAWPVEHFNGGEIRSKNYKQTANTTIYRGDFVTLVAAGTVQTMSSASQAILGVAAHYSAAAASSTNTNVNIYSDPFIVFGCQASNNSSTSSNENMIGGMADLRLTAGSATTQNSLHEVNITSVGTATAHVQILDKIDEPDNDWSSTSTMLLIKINEHLFDIASGAGI